MVKEILDKEIKKRIVKRIIEQNLTVAQVAREMDININTLYSWKKQYGLEFLHKALPKMTDYQQNRFLQKYICKLETENGFLKERISSLQAYKRDQLPKYKKEKQQNTSEV